MDVKGLCERLEQAATDWNGESMPDGAEPRPMVTCGDLREAATALSTLSRKLAEARAERDACKRDYDGGYEAGAGDMAGAVDAALARALAAEAALASKDERIAALEKALERAAEDFRTIKTLNSHGASDQTYIGWLRSNAEQGERRARSALTVEKTDG